MAAMTALLPHLAAGAVDPEAHRADIEAWRAKRLANLTSENGWLTLVALRPLAEGHISFGRASSNAFRLDHASLTAHAGTFEVAKDGVRFVAQPESGVTHDGARVTALDMQPDTSGAPTILASGTLRFFVIDRDGKRYVRVRDIEHPLRRRFAGLGYFPIDPAWVVQARFEPYVPPKRIPIMDILGEERPMSAPGALVFEKNGREWRLDAIAEAPDAEELFIMFADQTSARETYGAGRFLYVPRPSDGRVQVDFNKAYSPPCAFNEFATCPLPPRQNRLALSVTAGELKPAAPASR
jgi:uncharacterized protein (DUF1684 family)